MNMAEVEVVVVVVLVVLRVHNTFQSLEIVARLHRMVDNFVFVCTDQ
jgi:hypothetical protein